MSVHLEAEARANLRAAFARKAEAEAALAANKAEKAEINRRIAAAREHIESAPGRFYYAAPADKPQMAEDLKREKEALALLEAKHKALLWPRALEDRLYEAERDIKAAARDVVLAQPALRALFEEHRRLREKIWAIEATLYDVIQIKRCGTPPEFAGWERCPDRAFNGVPADPAWGVFLAALEKNPDAEAPGAAIASEDENSLCSGSEGLLAA
jgi:hypothetical protein